MKAFATGLLALLLVFPAVAAGSRDSSPSGMQTREITVGAAASLSDALDAALVVWKEKHPSIKVTPVYGASGALQKQIEQGAPIDVFISASPKQIIALEKGGLIVPDTRVNLFENEIVLIVPAGKRNVAGWADLAGSGVSRIALGEPTSVPAGQYAAETLGALGLLDAVKPKAVYAKDVRQALAYVTSGDADAGVVYRTDAISASGVEIIASAPEGTHSPVVYPAAVVTGPSDRQAARDFLAWLSTAEGSRAFARFGFIVKGK